jgi:hypothetical protein
VSSSTTSRRFSRTVGNNLPPPNLSSARRNPPATWAKSSSKAPVTRSPLSAAVTRSGLNNHWSATAVNDAPDAAMNTLRSTPPGSTTFARESSAPRTVHSLHSPSSVQA